MEPQWRCRSQRNLAEPSTSGVPPPKRFGELALQRKIIRHEFFPYVTATAGRNIPPCCLRERATTGSFPDIHPSLKVARNPANRLLEPLARNKVSLSRIESRPSQRRKWDYVFFIDLEGHIDDPPVAKALARLKTRASLYRVLGSYPRAVL